MSGASVIGAQQIHMELPMATRSTPTAYTAGGALMSWWGFWFCFFPVVLGAFVASLATGFWFIAVGLAGVGVLYAIWLPITFIFYKVEFQIWALQRPNNLLVRILLPAIEVLDNNRAGDAKNALYLQGKYGNNFCACGQVWLGSYKDVAAALTSPQARTNNLGEHILIPKHLLDTKSSRCIFLLALSDKGATGTGDHEAFRQCVLDHFFNDAARAREEDAYAEGLLDNLVKQYQELDFMSFYGDAGSGNFWIKYLHHVLFNLDGENAENMAALKTVHASPMSMIHFFTPVGNVVNYTSTFEKVTALYESAPALANFQEDAKYNKMTRHELCLAMVWIMRLAGVTGSQMYFWLLTSGTSHGYIPVDTRPYWDSVNLNDDAALRRYMLEVCRLSTPVTITHRVATEPFSCDIKGKTYKFPAGTKIGIPLCLAMVDKEHWGEDALQFNPNRPKLEESFLGFNSVGGQHAGRECPARGLVLRTMVRILRKMGQTRPRKPDPGPSPPVTKRPELPGCGCF